MRIGVITGEHPPMPGGVGDFTRILAGRLAGQGHDVNLLSRRGCHSDALPLTAVDGFGARGMAAIRGWARRLQPDVINMQFQTAAYDMSPLVHFLPDMLDAPFVTTFHDLRFPYLFPKAGRLRDWIVMRLARSSAGVICTNQEDDSRMQALPRRRVIPLGSAVAPVDIRPAARRQIRHEIGADAGSFVIAHFGFINAMKGIDNLLDALARLRAKGRDLRLVFVGGRENVVDGGKDADYLEQLDTRIERLGLRDALHWTGHASESEVAMRLGAADLVALPYADGASYRRSSLMAAIGLGSAIVTTRPAAPVPAFAHGENLWLVPPRSSDALATAIDTLLSDRAKLCQLRDGARLLSRCFDWDMIARDTADFYQLVMDSQR